MSVCVYIFVRPSKLGEDTYNSLGKGGIQRSFVISQSNVCAPLNHIPFTGVFTYLYLARCEFLSQRESLALTSGGDKELFELHK